MVNISFWSVRFGVHSCAKKKLGKKLKGEIADDQMLVRIQMTYDMAD